MQKTNCLICVVLLWGGARIYAARPLQVTIDPSIRYQTIDSFGASDAWRCQFVGKYWPLAKREAIADFLFSQAFDEQGNPQGIGLSLWRFYLSAGTAEQGEASGIQNPWRRGECFIDANGHYDWSKQAGQQWFLNAAKERGVEKLLAFSIAAPVFWSKNGKGYATKGDWSYNIAPGCYDDYAQYLVEVVAHFEKQGIHFDYLSPFNEPQWDWSKATQEGSPATNSELFQFTRLLSHHLAQRDLTTRLLIGEAAQLSFLIGPEQRRLDCSDQIHRFFKPGQRLYVGNLPNICHALSYHSYFSVWPVDHLLQQRQHVVQIVAEVDLNLELWQTEYCILQKNDEIGGGWGRDLGMDTALYVARIIHCDLTVGQVRSWQWWTALTQHDFKDGLIYLDDGQGMGVRRGDSELSYALMRDGHYRASKLLWVLGNYSRFVRPGMVRIQCHIWPSQDLETGVFVSAYTDPIEEGLVVVATNQSSLEQRIQLPRDGSWFAYTTSDIKDLQVQIVTGTEVELASRSVTSFVLQKDFP